MNRDLVAAALAAFGVVIVLASGAAWLSTAGAAVAIAIGVAMCLAAWYIEPNP